MSVGISSKAKIIIVIILIGMAWGFGFYLGRKKTKVITKTEIKYVTNTIIQGSLDKPKPFRETKPVDTLRIIEDCIEKGIYSELFPKSEKIVYVPSKVDTTAVMRDWSTIREYRDTLYDNDTTGTFVLYSNVQYNRIQKYAYEVTTVTKVVNNTELVVKGFSPYAGIGYVSGGFGMVNAGFYVKDKYGFSGIYQRDFVNGKNHYGGIISVKF